MNVLLTKRISRYLILITATLLMTACVSTKILPEDIPPALFSELEKDSTFYLNKDSQLGSDENLDWQFLAIQALIKEKKYVLANAVIDSLQTKKLTLTQSSTLALLIADKYYAQGKLPEAQASLIITDYQALSNNGYVHYLTLQSTLHIENNLPFEASESLLLLVPHLVSDEQRQQYNDLLLAQLIQLPEETLASFEYEEDNIETDAMEVGSSIEKQNLENQISENASQAVETISKQDDYQIDAKFKAGWYSLALLYQQHKLRPNRLNRALDEWKNTYPNHDALENMPLVLTNISASSPYQPDNIAVLLPLTGRFEKQGKAIQLGLLNAYYLQQKSLKNGDMQPPTLHFLILKKARQSN
ncbi:penicillin-binding protein activator [Psychromonas sp. KJ10-10]|uniref:penicillin-binding protein activator n=1 Tax=Psychromonas sp. KJ10-10 TaxID=3391823 RepID=UPI0039B43E92